jgi:AraC-like DNA-binding protein
MQVPNIYYITHQGLQKIHSEQLSDTGQTKNGDFGSFQYTIIQYSQFLRLDCCIEMCQAGSFMMVFPKDKLLAVLSLKGSCNLSTDSVQFLLSQGCYQILFSNSGIIHFILHKRHTYSFVFITIPLESIRPLANVHIIVQQLFNFVNQHKDVCLFTFPRIIPDQLNSDLRQSTKTGVPSRAEKDYFGYTLLTALRCELYDASHQYQDKDFGIIETHDEEQLYKGVWLILQNPASRISTKNMARIIHVNEYRLKKVFKRKFNLSVIEFQEHIRIEKAKAMLEEDKSIEEIANQLGYSSQSHFSSVFKRKTGLQPTVFRKYGLTDPDKITARHLG